MTVEKMRVMPATREQASVAMVRRTGKAFMMLDKEKLGSGHRGATLTGRQSRVGNSSLLFKEQSCWRIWSSRGLSPGWGCGDAGGIGGEVLRWSSQGALDAITEVGVAAVEDSGEEVVHDPDHIFGCAGVGHGLDEGFVGNVFVVYFSSGGLGEFVSDVGRRSAGEGP